MNRSTDLPQIKQKLKDDIELLCRKLLPPPDEEEAANANYSPQQTAIDEPAPAVNVRAVGLGQIAARGAA